MVTGREGRGEGKKGLGSSKACHFYYRKSHLKNEYKHQQERLKKKGQAAEAGIALSGLEKTEILMV